MCQMKLVFGKSWHRWTKGESHLTNLNAFYDKVTFLADVEQALDTDYMDSFKIFSVISHCLFLKKLMHCGLMVCAVGRELTRHTHRVLKNISFKNCQPAKTAVPQGSILSPKVFNLFIFGWDQVYLDGICWQIQRGRGHFRRESHPVGRPG